MPSRTELERIADSVVVATETDLGALRDQVGADIVALPVVAAAETGIGTVEVHGDREFPRLCLRRPGASGTDCPAALSYAADADGSPTAAGEWTIDGTWYVALASQGEAPQIVGGRDRTSSPDAGELPSEVTPAGEWAIHLVRPAPDIVSVCTRGEGWTSCRHHRGE